MASVHRVPRSPYWMAKFRADDGRVVMRSTKQVKRKAATIARYRPILHSFLAFITKQRARASVGSITTGEIERFRNQQIAEGKTTTTANLAVKVLRAVFASAKRLGYALMNPAEGVRLLHESDAEERLRFTEDQVRDLLQVADSEWRGMILIGAHTGNQILIEGITLITARRGASSWSVWIAFISALACRSGVSRL